MNRVMHCPFCGSSTDIQVAYFESNYDYELNCKHCGKFYIAFTQEVKELSEHSNNCQCGVHRNDRR